MKALKMCLNWKVIVGLAVIGAGLFAFAPGIAAAALPLLVLAICPLSMLLMMGAMNGMNKGGASAGGLPLERGEQLAQLRAQQQNLAEKIADLETEAAVTPKAV